MSERRDPTTGDLLAAHVAAQVAAMRRHADGVRRGEPEDVHRMRVAMRRLRSVLATYRRVVDRSVTDSIREDVRRVAAELGPARDLDVLHDHLLAQLEEDGPGGSRARRAVEEWLGPRRREALVRAAAAVDGAGLQRLYVRLDALVDELPVVSDGPASELVGGLLGHDWRRLEKAVDAALAAPAGSRDALLHEARKAAKRLRYGAESAVPVLGDRAAKLARRAKHIQTDLGTHQDAVVARAAIRDLGATPDAEVAFALGRLHALEQWRSYRADSSFARRWAKESARYPKGWMS